MSCFVVSLSCRERSSHGSSYSAGQLASAKTTLVEHAVVNALALDVLGRVDVSFLEDCVQDFFRTSSDEVAFRVPRPFFLLFLSVDAMTPTGRRVDASFFFRFLRGRFLNSNS